VGEVGAKALGGASPSVSGAREHPSDSRLTSLLSRSDQT
jgi:hypothetical protein